MKIPFKQWAAEEAMRQGVKPTAIYMRVGRGRYPNLKIERLNGRVALVDCDSDSIYRRAKHGGGRPYQSLRGLTMKQLIERCKIQRDALESLATDGKDISDRRFAKATLEFVENLKK